MNLGDGPRMWRSASEVNLASNPRGCGHVFRFEAGRYRRAGAYGTGGTGGMGGVGDAGWCWWPMQQDRH